MAKTAAEKAEYGRAWRAAHPGYHGKVRDYTRAPAPRTAAVTEYERKRRAAIMADPRERPRLMLVGAKIRAVAKGIPFNLAVEDIVIPEVCPILGIKLERSPTGSPWDASPSLDKIRPELGYVKGNVRVISHLANAIKRNCTDPDVFRKVADYLEWELFISPL